MIKNFLFITVFFYFSFFNTIVLANSIVYLDMNKIMNTSKPGISIIEQLNKINKNNLAFFDKSEKNFKKKEKTLLGQKNILSDDEFTKKVNNLRMEIKAYNKSREDKINKLSQQRLIATNNLLKSINPILTKYSDENSISLIIQKKNLVMGIKKLDITEKILIIINDQIKKTSIK